MSLWRPAISLGIAAVLGLVGEAPAQDQAGSAQAQSQEETTAGSKKADAPAIETATATFGGGCFWSIEATFERIRGVKSVVSGYAGGHVPYPSYEMVCTGMTGHAEVVQIEYDPKVVPYERLLKVFWSSHDPTTLNRQGPDVGTQYRSVIFYHDEVQKQAAQKLYRRLTAASVFPDPIVTQLVPYTAFYPAEPYHQDYYGTPRKKAYSPKKNSPQLKKPKLTRKTSLRSH
jgi:peptide-methionine (S)-S-oxide reductase